MVWRMSGERVEVEVKLTLDAAAELRLLEGTEPLEAVRLDDLYYDDAARSLAQADRWLRKRNERFELKLPVGARPQTRSQAYREVAGPELEAILGPPPGPYAPAWQVVSTRQSYRYDDFIVSVDRTDFGYRIAEIELDVPAGEESQALVRLEGFLAERDLILEPTPGKLAVLIAQTEPALYAKLAQREIFPVFAVSDLLFEVSDV
jgi:adenylate cyclase class IV